MSIYKNHITKVNVALYRYVEALINLEAFVNRGAAAKAICKEDDEVDALYYQADRVQLSFMIRRTSNNY
jgi:hypothetical protein